MLRPRIIPCLLVHRGGLVKTIEFKNPKYIGDPINTVKIFNEKEADELIVLDIDATVNGSDPDYKMISNLAAECRMPLCYGGGIRNAEQAKKIISLGVEKISISSAAVEDISLVSRIADSIGRQSVVAVLDVRFRSGFLSKGHVVYTHNGKRAHKQSPTELAMALQNAGAGEIVFNSINNDGQMSGYDIDFARSIRQHLSIPITFLGGAGSHQDIESLFTTCGVVGAAAGSMFVFKGPYRAVLINYPNRAQKDRISEASYAHHSLQRD